MFTGIITRLGRVVSYQLKNDSCVIKIAIKDIEVSLGESIACDGVCLTVSAILQDSVYEFDVSLETLSCTNLSLWQEGYVCNIELALALGSRLNGHLVSGHVDSTAVVDNIEYKEDYISLSLLLKQGGVVINKGSIAVNGVSLTINKVEHCKVEIMLVPHTIKYTNLQYLKSQDIVNIEYDMLYKMIQQHAEKYLEK